MRMPSSMRQYAISPQFMSTTLLKQEFFDLIWFAETMRQSNTEATDRLTRAIKSCRFDPTTLQERYTTVLTHLEELDIFKQQKPTPNLTGLDKWIEYFKTYDGTKGVDVYTSIIEACRADLETRKLWYKLYQNDDLPFAVPLWVTDYFFSEVERTISPRPEPKREDDGSILWA